MADEGTTPLPPARAQGAARSLATMLRGANPTFDRVEVVAHGTDWQLEPVFLGCIDTRTPLPATMFGYAIVSRLEDCGPIPWQGPVPEAPGSRLPAPGFSFGAAPGIDRAISDAYGLPTDVVAAVIAVANRLGTDPGALANLIAFESGWNPAAVNPRSGATGLIQFMPTTAASLGTTTEALKGMSARQQMRFVEAYLRSVGGPISRPEDLYLAVFYPKARGGDLNQVFPSAVRHANPGIDTPRDYVMRVEGAARVSTGTIQRIGRRPSAESGEGGGLGLLLLGILGAVGLARAGGG